MLHWYNWSNTYRRDLIITQMLNSKPILGETIVYRNDKTYIYIYIYIGLCVTLVNVHMIEFNWGTTRNRVLSFALIEKY